MPTFGSLFAGIGGLDLGLERAGFHVAWQVENDPYCQRVLAKHWPDTPRYGDITALDPGVLAPVDLICGGFPCQPVSVAGKRLAQADARWLWPEFSRIVRALRPRLVLVENVPGLLHGGAGDVLGDLAASGYDAEWDCIPASALGAPHQRDRVWLVAYPSSGRGQRRRPEWIRANQTGPLNVFARSDSRSNEMANADEEHGRARRAGRPAGVGTRVREQPLSGALPDAASRRAQQSCPQRYEWGFQNEAVRGVGHSGHWATEPDVGRVAHGVPARVDRLRGLGNAVVPQVAEWIGHRLMEAMRG